MLEMPVQYFCEEEFLYVCTMCIQKLYDVARTDGIALDISLHLKSDLFICRYCKLIFADTKISFMQIQQP